MDRKSRTSRSATLEETNEELSLWKQICSSLLKLETIQEDTHKVLNNINKDRMSHNIEDGLLAGVAERLKECYKSGIGLSETEASTIRDIIEKLSVLIALREASEQNGSEQKRKKRKSEADELKSTSSSPKKAKIGNGIIPSGTSVAAKQPKQKDKNEEWILALVINYHADKSKYEVEDVDQDENGQKLRYMLQPRNVIPVVDPDEARATPEVGTGNDVLALYPGTTCFYKAIVLSPPSKTTGSYIGNYKVQFEDDNNEVKYVMPEHVLEIPKAK